MNPQWYYVIAAYALTVVLTAVTLVNCWQVMRRAERRADAIRQEKP